MWSINRERAAGTIGIARSPASVLVTRTPGMCVFGRGRIGNWMQDFQLCNGVVEV